MARSNGQTIRSAFTSISFRSTHPLSALPFVRLSQPRALIADNVLLRLPFHPFSFSLKLSFTFSWPHSSPFSFHASYSILPIVHTHHTMPERMLFAGLHLRCSVLLRILFYSSPPSLLQHRLFIWAYWNLINFLVIARGQRWIALLNHTICNLFQLRVSFVSVKNAAGLTCTSNDIEIHNCEKPPKIGIITHAHFHSTGEWMHGELNTLIMHNSCSGFMPFV